MFQNKGIGTAEVFSQPRIAQEASLRNYDGVRLTPGWSLDLTREDPLTGKPWDLSRYAVRRRVKQIIQDTEPFMVIGSPPCTMFSPMQNLNAGRMDPKAAEKALHAAKEHVKFCLELYRIQMLAGRYFLHEHPNAASSWSMPEVVKMLMEDDVDVVTCDMCAYGLSIDDPLGHALVEKRTRLMSNSPEVLKRVSRQCSNRTATNPADKHRHADTLDGRIRLCQVYPREFCRAVCAGVAAQKKLRNLGMMAAPLLSLSWT